MREGKMSKYFYYYSDPDEKQVENKENAGEKEEADTQETPSSPTESEG